MANLILQNPTDDEQNALRSYFHLQARLYPCGECAAEFQQLLKKLPPQVRFAYPVVIYPCTYFILLFLQTSSRRAAALWLCHVHNQVNDRLGKPIFDCAFLDDTYDCGCGDEPINKDSETGANQMQDEQTGAGLIKGGR